jgi:O-antigen/teichoic acid export membrane protein
VDQALTRQMSVLFIGRGVAFLFVFALPLVLVRIFPPEDFGLYKQLFLIHGTLVTILTFGFSASLYYFVPRHTPHEQQSYVTQTLFMLTVLGLAGAGLLVAFKSQIAQTLNNPGLEQYLPYLAAFTVLSLVASVLETLMVILKRAKQAAVTSLGSEVLRAGLMIGAAVLTRNMLVLVLAALAWAGCRFMVLLAYLRWLGISWWSPLGRHRLAEQFRYSIPFGFAVIVRTCADNLHQFVVSYLYSPALFAVYSVGYLQIPFIAILFESVSDVTLVSLTELRKDGLLEEAVRLMGDSVTKLALLLFPLYAWLMVNARDLIVLLFTERFAESVDIFRVFLTAIPLTAVSLGYVPRAFAETGLVMRMGTIRMGVTAALLLVMVPLFGLIGAGLATVLAMGFTEILILSKVAKLFSMSINNILPWKQLAKIGAASLVVSLAAFSVQAMLTLQVVLQLVLSVAIFTLCYSAIVWTTDLFEPGDKRRVICWVQGLAKLNRV